MRHPVALQLHFFLPCLQPRRQRRTVGVFDWRRVARKSQKEQKKKVCPPTAPPPFTSLQLGLQVQNTSKFKGLG